MLPFTSWIAMIATVASLEKVPNIYKSNSQSTYIYITLETQINIKLCYQNICLTLIVLYVCNLHCMYVPI